MHILIITLRQLMKVSLLSHFAEKKTERVNFVICAQSLSCQ